MEKNIAKIAVSAATFWTDKPYDYAIPGQFAETLRPGMRVLVPFSRSNRKCEGIVLAVTGESAYGQLKPIAAVLDDAPILTPAQLKLALWMRERCFCTVYDAVKAILPAGLWYDIQEKLTLSEGYDKALAYDAAGKSGQQCMVLDVLFANGGTCEKSQVERAFGETSPDVAIRALAKKGVLTQNSQEKRKVADKMREFAVLAVSGEEAMAEAAAKQRRAPAQASVLKLIAEVGRVSVAELKYFTGCTAQPVKALEKAGLIRMEQEEVYRHKVTFSGELLPLPVLTDSQQIAYEGIKSLTDSGKPACALLLGVTGSGKTTVYLHLIDEMRKQGKSAILLVPEIALTPQMLQTFSSHFGEEIAVLHSSLSVAERYDEWKRVKKGEARVVIGTRSAVFAPVDNLGILIMDEEQEDTYKSENAPRYHAREVAQWRGLKENALVVLGSATPSVETMYYARTGRYILCSLSGRYNGRGLPSVEIVDLRRELEQGNASDVSYPLQDAIRQTADSGKQTILFLNRRGNSRALVCVDCREAPECPRCSARLTYHSANERLMCHYCGHSQPVPPRCPACGGPLKRVGSGTQKVQEELEALFPDLELLRMDADTVSAANPHEKLLDRFKNENIPLLLGTQMVAKGLNLPNVTLVGVLDGDLGLYNDSYRVAETTFDMLTQVVGRAGRGESSGRAVIQTLVPEHKVITLAAAQDYEGFYQLELGLRRVQQCPPFGDQTLVTFSGPYEARVLRGAVKFRDSLTQLLKTPAYGEENCTVLGPAACPVAKINYNFRYRLTLRCTMTKPLRLALAHFIRAFSQDKEKRGVSVFVDVNGYT